MYIIAILSPITALSEIFGKIMEFFSDLVSMITTALAALDTFLSMLQEFDRRVVRMADSCATSELDGFPVIKAIATYHYAVGDIVFYIMYCVILAGCLFTIYKLIILIYQGTKQFFTSIGTGISSSATWTTIVGKFFK